MAEIIPFKGILYNPEKINNFAKVITPPFDVISKKDQQKFYESHPNNIIRLILGKSGQKDTSQNNRYTRAAEQFNSWLSDGIITQDKKPAFYLTAIDFIFENRKVTRYGLVALIRIEPFEKGVVLPHEKTFSGVKSERLELMKACRANLSSIFSLYADRNNVFGLLREEALKNEPDLNFTDASGILHRLWRITAENLHRHVFDSMKGSKIFIADGHHRYETALKYREYLSENDPDFNEDHPANYVMMYLCSMEDPGLVILPAHRMLREVDESRLNSSIEKAEKYFDIKTISFKEETFEKAREKFISGLKSDVSKNIIGIFVKSRREFYLLTLKPNAMEQKFGNEIPESLKYIDVTVLTRLIFMEILGFDRARLDNDKLIGYSSIAEEAINKVNAGKYDIAFILNPTRIGQVRRIAEEGLIMPRKATYFYPKVIVGQVLNKLDA